MNDFSQYVMIYLIICRFIQLFKLMSFHQVPECYRLNTPPPIMATCIAPPILADPFRSALHHSRDLGSSTVIVNPLVAPSAQLCQVVVQLTQDEDQAITNLLKLHHQEAPSPNDTMDTQLKCPLSSLPEHPSTDAGSAVPQSSEAMCWSVQEIEAANILSRFGQMAKEQNQSAWKGPPTDPPSAQSYSGYAGGTSSVQQATWTSPPSQECRSYSEREQQLSDSERDALQALQSLGHVAQVNSFSNLHS